MDINSITPSYIDSLAANSSAITAAKGVMKSKLVRRNIASDNSLIFGECSGSGKSNYGCSMDLLSGTARCTCPSRQVPCKHVLGLLYAYADDKNSFTIEKIPDDIAKKRERLDKRLEEKTNPTTKKPKNVSVEKDAKAAAKRIAVQLEGLQIAEKLLGEILKLGFVALNSNAISEYRVRVKELGNYYINGVTIRFNELLAAIKLAQNAETDKHLKAAILLYELISQGRCFLTEKLKNPLEIRTDIDIEEQLGFVWKTEKLIEAGLTLENVKLAELFYRRNFDNIRREWVTESALINLESGEIYRKVGYYPVRQGLVVADDYVYGVLNIALAAIYPGLAPRRIRFDSATIKQSEFTAETAAKIKSFAAKSYAAVIKNAKNSLRNPLHSGSVTALLFIHDILYTENKKAIITDSDGAKITLDSRRNSDNNNRLDRCRAVYDFSREKIVGEAICVSLECDSQNGMMYADPLGVFDDSKLIRLL
jgi:hypothetical protein